MRAAVRRKYGPPEMLQIEDIPRPVPKDREVLVRVYAVSLNTSDVEFMTGTPFYARIFGLFTPRFPILGTDVAGVVEEVGSKVSRFVPGNEVVGDMLGRGGALAEYTCAPESTLVPKPQSLSFEEAATFPQASVIALQGIEEEGGAAQGTKVLINGAGGGSGSFGIQLAKSLGAEVTGVDNEWKQDFMRSLGADHVVDYEKEDYVARGERYDLILDLAGFRSLREHNRALAPGGRYLMVGGSMRCLLEALVLGPLLSRSGKKLRVLGVESNRGLEKMLALCEAGTIRPVIQRTFSLEESALAVADVAQGKALGNLVVTI